MSNRAVTGSTLTLVAAALAAFACSPSPTGATAAERADGAAQAVREDALEIPCAPRAVLQSICQQCHSLSPKNGAPFPLVRRSDVLATRAGVVVRVLMMQQLEAQRMPLAPVTIDPAARAVLLDWLRDGAPSMEPSECTPPPASEDGGLEPIDGATHPPPDACPYPCPDVDASAPATESDAAPE